MRAPYCLLNALVLGSFVVGGTARAADQQLPAKQAVLLLFKSLTFDGNISKGRSELRIGVLSAQGQDASAKRAKEVLDAIASVSGMKVRGLKLSGAHLALTAKAAVEPLVVGNKANVLYLGAGLKDLGPICQLAEKSKALVISGEPEHAQACSAITVVRRDDKPVILVNRVAAKAQGAALGEQLLKLATIVK